MSHHVYVNPENIVSYPGDIQREHPDWQVGDELPNGWHEVGNTECPDLILIYPEFEEGQDETNTAPIQATRYEPELSVTTDENGVSVYSFIWNPATYDIVEELPPHEKEKQRKLDAYKLRDPASLSAVEINEYENLSQELEKA